MAPNTVMDDAKPELVRVWVDTTRVWGILTFPLRKRVRVS